MRVRLGREAPVLVVPAAEFGEQALGVPFAQYDQVVETLAAKSADHPLRECAHPRRSHRGADFADAEAPHSGPRRQAHRPEGVRSPRTAECGQAVTRARVLTEGVLGPLALSREVM
jgi:hypothetical protein